MFDSFKKLIPESSQKLYIPESGSKQVIEMAKLLSQFITNGQINVHMRKAMIYIQEKA